MHCPFSITKLLFASRNIFHPWHRKVRKIYTELESSQWFSIDQLVDIQTKKLRQLCSNAYRNCKYYHKLFNDCGLNPNAIRLDELSIVPIITKKIIRENFEKLINNSIPEKKRQVAVTGGSTGTPLKILRTIDSYIYAAAIRMRNNNWAGYQFGMPHYRVWGAPTDILYATQKTKNKFIAWLNNIHYVNAFNITDNMLYNLYNSLQRNQKSYLESYSNILYEFSRFIEKKKLPPLNIHSVISSAGTLYDFQREKINKNISANLYNRYGCREVGNIAHECEAHTGMHINMERYILEILETDSAGNGKIVVTDLENQAFPMIRYVIEDDGRLATETCPCGRNLVMLSQVTGRSLDIILTPEGRKISGELFPHLFKDFPEILTGQVIQRETGRIEILLRLTEKNVENNFIAPLCSAIKKNIGDKMILDIKVVDKLTVNKTGKYRPVINTLLSEI